MENKKEYPYLEHNLQVIGQQLKFLNWNLGKLTAHFLKEKEVINKIKEAENNEKEKI